MYECDRYLYMINIGWNKISSITPLIKNQSKELKAINISNFINILDNNILTEIVGLEKGNLQKISELDIRYQPIGNR